MKQITINLYEFKELSKEVQEKVIDNLCDINTDYNWWETTYEDAKRSGIKITSFDIDRREITGELINSANQSIISIMKEHGEQCRTYKTADKYLKTYNKLPDNSDLSDFEHEYLNDILDDYLDILANECDYLQSKEAIIETIESNEYTFEANGKMRNA